MSYILDAIRKSEQQRQSTEAPSLFTQQITNEKKRPPYLLYSVVAAILICAGILIGWLGPWQQGKKDIATEHDHATSSTLSLPQTADLVTMLKQESTNKAEHHSPAADSTPKGGTTTYRSPPARAGEDLSKTSASQAADESVVPTIGNIAPRMQPKNDIDSTEPAKDQKVVAFEELPLSIQQEIPKLVISGYAYASSPRDRTVGINDQLLQEGEYISQGLKLERIGPDGLVFSYKKYRFRPSLR